MFRFFPSDAVVKVAQARYVVETLKKQRPAIVYQTTAYGQGGKKVLEETFAKLSAMPVFSEGVDTSIKDLLPVLTRARAANPDVLVLQLHAPSTALILKQAAAAGLGPYTKARRADNSAAAASDSPVTVATPILSSAFSIEPPSCATRAPKSAGTRSDEKTTMKRPVDAGDATLAASIRWPAASVSAG